ncbi:DUF5592 family protein [Lentilactobacillus hilgardii]|uniref:DUF5592 family protein n=1 Tax=Lentilactobacillus hilgardii TaxID=1588 RepID=UPI0021A2F6E3|nr:DUF5592 family protein [Lentilactobacillus hilgardii]MCT3398648.1 hypothetical protein [Lentilactobacillus hilgardii]
MFGSIKGLGVKLKIAPMLYLRDAITVIAFFAWGGITADWFIPQDMKLWQIIYWIYCIAVGTYLILPAPNPGKRNYEMIIMMLQTRKGNEYYSI